MPWQYENRKEERLFALFLSLREGEGWVAVKHRQERMESISQSKAGDPEETSRPLIVR